MCFNRIILAANNSQLKLLLNNKVPHILVQDVMSAMLCQLCYQGLSFFLPICSSVLSDSFLLNWFPFVVKKKNGCHDSQGYAFFVTSVKLFSMRTMDLCVSSTGLLGSCVYPWTNDTHQEMPCAKRLCN